MLRAHVSINPLKARSAMAELPREWRKRLISDAGVLEDWAAALDETALAVSIFGGAAVSSLGIRISDKGTVTSLRLMTQCEQHVNRLQNQAHTSCLLVT
jgi:hypothetical protein